MTSTAIQERPATASGLRQPILATIAVVPVLATVYQTLVLTDVTGDVIRKGIEGDSYQMLWTNLTWGIATLYGIFLGLWAMARIGARLTIPIGLAIFALGNGLCGASVDVPSLAAARLVEGIGKGMTIGRLQVHALPPVRPGGPRRGRDLRRHRLLDPAADSARDGLSSTTCSPGAGSTGSTSRSHCSASSWSSGPSARTGRRSRCHCGSTGSA